MVISRFQAADFVVYADDHIGHGKTAVDSGTLGDPHSKDYHTYLADEKALHDIAVKEYPDIPYMVFGHSWGSMLARAYAAERGCNQRPRESRLQLDAVLAELQQAMPQGGALSREIQAIRSGCR